MRRCEAVIELTAAEREELTGWSKSRILAAGDVFKALLILALADGKSYSSIEAELNTSRPTIARWKSRFEQDRIPGWKVVIRAAGRARPRLRCRREY